MSYLHIGKNVMVSRRRIIGVFDLDITSQSPRTREFLDRAERDGVVLDAGDRRTGENAKAEMANAVPELERFKEAQQN